MTGQEAPARPHKGVAVDHKKPGAGWRFHPPPGWPPAPPGWAPPPGWRPDPSWPAAPDDWRWWVPASADEPSPTPPTPTQEPTGRPWPARHKTLTVLAAALAVLLLYGSVRAAAPSLRDAAGPARALPSAAPSAAPSTAAPPPPSTSSPAGSAAPPTRDAAAVGTPAAPAPGTALALLGTLAVKGRAPLTGYARDRFGPAWADTDRNGCDTRDDILRRDLVATTVKAGPRGCVVLAGDLAPDPYTGARIRFVRGGASEVDIDHVVALADAWQKGAAGWAPAQRLAFANDPLNLLAVAAAANRQKGDGDAATWLPANKAYRCAYVARQVAVKARYRLWVTAAEHDAIARVLAGCPQQAAPSGGPAPAPPPAAPPPTASSPAPPPPPGGAAQGVRPGAFCSPPGASGYTSSGRLMRCTTSATDPRYRWRAA